MEDKLIPVFGCSVHEGPLQLQEPTGSTYNWSWSKKGWKKSAKPPYHIVFVGNKYDAEILKQQRKEVENKSYRVRAMKRINKAIKAFKRKKK